MANSVTDKKSRRVCVGYRPRVARRSTLDWLTAKARSNHVRWFDPTIGRWLSQDPLGLLPDSNPYRYCGNAPTDGIDPSGLGDFDGFVPQVQQSDDAARNYQQQQAQQEANAAARGEPPSEGQSVIIAAAAQAELDSLYAAALEWNKTSPGFLHWEQGTAMFPMGPMIGQGFTIFKSDGTLNDCGGQAESLMRFLNRKMTLKYWTLELYYGQVNKKYNCSQTQMNTVLVRPTQGTGNSLPAEVFTPVKFFDWSGDFPMQSKQEFDTEYPYDENGKSK